MSIRIKYLILAFFVSIVLWGGVIGGGAWLVGGFVDPFDRNPTAGVR
jgi:hypothetical protein